MKEIFQRLSGNPHLYPNSQHTSMYTIWVYFSISCNNSTLLRLQHWSWMIGVCGSLCPCHLSLVW